jgi:uncharacterized protein YndB with AHSA1/START domain
VIRGAIRLMLFGAGITYALDRILREQAQGADPEPIESMIVIDAPIERVWGAIADIEGQPRWMTDMKAVRLASTEPVAVGTTGEADVRILGINVVDPVTVTEFDPPHRFAIRHDGTFKGHGLITLEEGADGTTTIVRWEELLIPPILPHLAGLAMTPTLAGVFQADLERLKELVEAGSPAA